jgi:hypothetical protein
MEGLGFHYFHPRWDEGFHRLYTKAGQEQWSVGALPWHELGAIDADWRTGMLNLLSPLLVSERGAMQACGTMLPRVREQGLYDVELVMHAMMLDEAATGRASTASSSRCAPSRRRCRNGR